MPHYLDTNKQTLSSVRFTISALNQKIKDIPRIRKKGLITREENKSTELDSEMAEITELAKRTLKQSL